MSSDALISGLLVAEPTVQPQARSEDATLVARCRQGDQAAFQQLVEKYRPVALRAAYGLLRDAELARDISQEAFVRVYRKLASFDTSRPFATWLRRITVNLAIDLIRRQKRRGEVPLGDEMPRAESPDPAAEAQAAEDRRAVWEVLNQLPLNYRTVMILREIEGMSTEEVARSVGRPQVSVRWRLHRARKLFRKLWTARFGEE